MDLTARKENEMRFDDVYPLTILRDRYSGSYSGGKYTAWNLYPWDIPDGPFSDDGGCFDFWLESTIPVGVGETPNAAIRSLVLALDDRIEVD